MNSTPEIELRKLRLQEQELELKHAQLAVEFSRYGFFGTLFGSIAGFVLILSLAILDAFSSDFTYGIEGVLGSLFLIAAGVIAFGAYSLRQPMKLLLKLSDQMSLGIDSGSDKTDASVKNADTSRES